MNGRMQRWADGTMFADPAFDDAASADAPKEC
jgi:hypothetical protein